MINYTRSVRVCSVRSISCSSSDNKTQPRKKEGSRNIWDKDPEPAFDKLDFFKDSVGMSIFHFK